VPAKRGPGRPPTSASAKSVATRGRRATAATNGAKPGRKPRAAKAAAPVKMRKTRTPRVMAHAADAPPPKRRGRRTNAEKAAMLAAEQAAQESSTNETEHGEF
jgi:hypothetical protein